MLCAGSWSPSANSQNEWILVEFETLHRVQAVSALGRPDASLAQYVTAFNLTSSLDGINFVQPVTGSGNLWGPAHLVSAELSVALVGRYFRLRPLVWNNQIAMRFDFKGCQSKLL